MSTWTKYQGLRTWVNRQCNNLTHLTSAITHRHTHTHLPPVWTSQRLLLPNGSVSSSRATSSPSSKLRSCSWQPLHFLFSWYRRFGAYSASSWERCSSVWCCTSITWGQSRAKGGFVKWQAFFRFSQCNAIKSQWKRMKVVRSNLVDRLSMWSLFRLRVSNLGLGFYMDIRDNCLIDPWTWVQILFSYPKKQPLLYEYWYLGCWLPKN